MTALAPLRSLLQDPRHFQIGILSSLLLYGVTCLGFDIDGPQIAVTLLTAIALQIAAARVFQHGPGTEPFRLLAVDVRSALISGLSLCLLLRTNDLSWVVVAVAVTVLSKFLIRRGDKHVFNPTNFGIVVVLLLSDRVWVSPGQWGSTAMAAFFFACLGFLVTQRAARSDVTLAFLIFHAASIFGRALLLGDPLTIPIHQLESGSLLLFAFFMISDPRTTPNSRAGRIVFAFLVAALAWFIRFRLFHTNSTLWSLACVSGGVWLIDLVLPGVRYHWPRERPPALSLSTTGAS